MSRPPARRSPVRVSPGYGEFDAEAATNPTGAVKGGMHPLRGGSWDAIPAYCRVANRDASYPWYHHDNEGFRVVVAAGGE